MSGIFSAVNWASYNYGARVIDFSSELDGCEAKNVLDGKKTTIWLSNDEDKPQWLCISLRDINKIQQKKHQMNNLDDGIIIRTIGWYCWHSYSTNPKKVVIHVSRDSRKFKFWDTLHVREQSKGTQLFCCDPINTTIYPFIVFEIVQSFGSLQTYMNRIFLYSEEVLSSPPSSDGEVDKLSISNSFDEYDDDDIETVVSTDSIGSIIKSLKSSNYSILNKQATTDMLINSANKQQSQSREDDDAADDDSHTNYNYNSSSYDTDLLVEKLQEALGLVSDSTVSVSDNQLQNSVNSYNHHQDYYYNLRDDTLLAPSKQYQQQQQHSSCSSSSYNHTVDQIEAIAEVVVDYDDIATRDNHYHNSSSSSSNSSSSNSYQHQLLLDLPPCHPNPPHTDIITTTTSDQSSQIILLERISKLESNVHEIRQQLNYFHCMTDVTTSLTKHLNRFNNHDTNNNKIVDDINISDTINKLMNEESIYSSISNANKIPLITNNTNEVMLNTSINNDISINHKELLIDSNIQLVNSDLQPNITTISINDRISVLEEKLSLFLDNLENNFNINCTEKTNSVDSNTELVVDNCSKEVESLSLTSLVDKNEILNASPPSLPIVPTNIDSIISSHDSSNTSSQSCTEYTRNTAPTEEKNHHQQSIHYHNHQSTQSTMKAENINHMIGYTENISSSSSSSVSPPPATAVVNASDSINHSIQKIELMLEKFIETWTPIIIEVKQQSTIENDINNNGNNNYYSNKNNNNNITNRCLVNNVSRSQSYDTQTISKSLEMKSSDPVNKVMSSENNNNSSSSDHSNITTNTNNNNTNNNNIDNNTTNNNNNTTATNNNNNNNSTLLKKLNLQNIDKLDHNYPQIYSPALQMSQSLIQTIHNDLLPRVCQNYVNSQQALSYINQIIENNNNNNNNNKHTNIVEAKTKLLWGNNEINQPQHEQQQHLLLSESRKEIYRTLLSKNNNNNNCNNNIKNSSEKNTDEINKLIKILHTKVYERTIKEAQYNILLIGKDTTTSRQTKN